MTMSIAIYIDSGANPKGVRQWIHHFKRLGIPYAKVLADDILNESIYAHDILIMPGGADTPYCEKLHGQGVQVIQNFVRQGGRYVGSCAGAYFAHNHITWHNTTESIVANRELALFHGTAKGPLHKPYDPNSEHGALPVPMKLTPDPLKIGTAMVYLNGGPAMAVDTNTTVCAEFVMQNHTYPAIIYKKIEKGDAIALSPHIEYTESFLHKKIPTCPNRQPMWEYIVQHIILKPFV